MTRTSALLIAALTAGVTGLGLTPAAPVAGLGRTRCLCRGLRLELTSPTDHVCVPQAVQDQAAADNSQEEARRNPEGGPYGPATCLEGYVWREATPEDLVCVVPEVRTTTAQENAEAPNRWKATVRADGRTPTRSSTLPRRTRSPSCPRDAARRNCPCSWSTPKARRRRAEPERRSRTIKAHRVSGSIPAVGRRSGPVQRLPDRGRFAGSCLTVAEFGKGNGTKVVASSCKATPTRSGRWPADVTVPGTCAYVTAASA